LYFDSIVIKNHLENNYIINTIVNCKVIVLLVVEIDT